MGNNSVPKFIFRLSRFPVYRGSVLGRVYCIFVYVMCDKKNTDNNRKHKKNSTHNPE